MEHIIAKLLHDFEHGQMSRRQLIQSLALTATAASAAGAVPLAAADGKGFKATAVNHISYQVADYKRTRDFYTDLLGMKVSQDDGKGQCYLAFGDTFLLPRNGRAGVVTPHVDHIAITIEKFDKKAVEAELKRRGLTPREDQESFHVKDPDGFDLQISSTEMKP
jgi:catechol 2,3-dioxygenase-like lactoylglutathione lyase family enzyme